MGEPARKLSEIEPDISPKFGLIQGGGQSTPDRANLKAVDDLENNPKGLNTGSIADQEEKGSNIGAEPNAEKFPYKKLTSSKFKGWAIINLRKKGPYGLIIALLLGGTAFFSPGLLIVHMKETMVTKFNAQLASMDVRTTKILKTKTIGGALCATFNKCRYQTMSTKQIAKFEAAGIKVYSEDALFGRKRPVSFEFEGKPISASEFNNELGNSPKFRSAVRKAYSSKFAGFVDSIWEKITAKFKISKAATEIAGADEDASLKNVQKATSTPELEVADHQGVDHSTQTNEVDPKTQKLVTEDGGTYPAFDDTEGPSNTLIEQNGTIMNDIRASADDIANGAADKAGAGAAEEVVVALAAKSSDAFKLGVMNTVVNGTKVTGILDNACTVYRAVQALGYAAKVVRALQLARFAMLFLNVADQIKAGVANPDDVSYLGKILTTEIATSLASMKFKSATDSFGYKFAAYNERGQMSTLAMQFLAGGGLPGQIINVTDTINRVLGGTPKATCKLLGNTFVGIGSAVAGIAMMFIPAAGPILFGAKEAVSVVTNLAFTVGMMFIPELLKDIVAGVLVDKNTVGETAGDAFTSGASGLMGSMAQRGGNAPLIPAQAIEYNNLSKQVAAQYAEEDRLAYSPFDISNSNTFMGKIFAQLIPYATNMSSLPGILTSIASMPVRSLAMVTSNNAMAIDTESNYTMCPDLDYNNLTDVAVEGDRVKLATDPYCNVMYGIPPGELETDPMEVVDALGGEIDPESGMIVEGSDYQTFFTDCIARDRPLGDKGADFQRTDGSECLFDYKPINKYYYLYYIDQRVLSGMDDDEMKIDPNPIPYTYTPPEPLPTPVSNGSGYSFTQTQIDNFDNTTDLGPSCAFGTTDAGFSGNIRLCSIPNTVNFYHGGGTVVVNSRVSGAWLALKKAFLNELNTDIMYARNGVADDGLSESESALNQHNLYLALDIDMENMEKQNAAIGGNRNYEWLVANAGRFGIEKGEVAWHWTPTGS
jgi:hypothetical protein